MYTLFLLVEKNQKKLEKSLYAMVASYYAEKYCVSENDIRIKKSGNGKPYVIIRGNNTSNFFNISHTTGVGIVIFSNYEVGIDIEEIRNAVDEIVDRFFSRNEKKYLNDSEDEKIYRKRFFEIWTKKEAYLKWNGEGLSRGFLGLDVMNKKYELKARSMQ